VLAFRDGQSATAARRRPICRDNVGDQAILELELLKDQ
jgi:hypothetical protein